MHSLDKEPANGVSNARLKPLGFIGVLRSQLPHQVIEVFVAPDCGQRRARSYGHDAQKALRNVVRCFDAWDRTTLWRKAEANGRQSGVY